MKTPPSKTRLTVPKIAAFSCPAGRGQAFLWDTQTPGLALRVSAQGRKSFVLEARLRGKTMRLTIGDPAAWPLGAARIEAMRLKMLIDAGHDPRELARQQDAEREATEAQAEAERKAAEAQAVTVGEIWGRYLTERRPHWGERHYQDHLDMMRAGGEPKKRGKGVTTPGPLHQFAAVRLVDMEPEAVQAWAAEEAQSRPTRARLALHLLHAFLAWCTEQRDLADLVPDKNPARNRRAREVLGKPQAKRDALLKEQLPAWFAAVRDMNNPAHAAYLQALLLTGARPGELQALCWEDVDSRWRSVALRDKDESKGGRDGFRLVPLTPYVHYLLAGLPRRSLFVFAGATGAPLHRPNVQHTKACRIAGIEGLTLHGLRRSFGTLAEWQEVPAGVVAQIMGHKPSATAEKHYRVRPLDLLRVHHEKLERWILEQAGVQFDASKEPGKLRAVIASIS
ncbi:MAG TPA: integrase family protein [Ottowia sp.]|nr:integrase family protein [Ottowia sp.]